VEHNTVTGDDRGGSAVSTSQVFYTGDSFTGRFALADLSGGTSVGRQYDAIIGNVRDGTVYTFASSGTPIGMAGGSANQLIEIDGMTGALTTRITALSMPIPIGTSNVGYFAGYDRLVVLTSGRAYQVLLPSGTVQDLGAMAVPPHSGCESYGFWGTAEFFGGQVYIDYVSSRSTISRTQVPSGPTTTLATFTDLSDMCSFTFSTRNNRWYWHHEGVSQFGGSDESVGFCNATFDQPGSTFRVTSLGTTGCIQSGDVQAVVSDDRGGIAVSSTNLFYQGDSNTTASMSAADMSGLVNTMQSNDGLISDLATETVYVLLNAMGAQPAPFGGTPFTITQLGALNGTNAALTPVRIVLSRPITIGSDVGLYAGYGFIVIHTGSGAGITPEWFRVDIPSGTVTSLGTQRAAPGHQQCETYAHWGIAENFSGDVHVLYMSNSGFPGSPGMGIARYRIRDGMAAMFQTLPSIGDVCMITFSPTRNRWYLHYEGAPSFLTPPTGGEFNAVCPATFDQPSLAHGPRRGRPCSRAPRLPAPSPTETG
jgi:hypothetical protein